MPKIISVPDLKASVGLPWAYDADRLPTARGTRPLVWTVGALVGGQTVGAPAGLSVDAFSGELRWTPVVAGIHRVLLAARNAAGSDVQSFDIEVEGATVQGPREIWTVGCACGSAAPAWPLLWVAALFFCRRRRS